MTAFLYLLSVLALSVLTVCNPLPSTTKNAAVPAFTYNATTFLLHGEPYQIIGGQIDPQRIPKPYWRDRLARVRALGLNTIFPYIFWNLLEPEQGQWLNEDDSNDIAQFFRIAQEEGLHVVLRPGPYICGEREWGGFPYWLSTVPGLVVRQYNKPYLAAAKAYLERLAGDLRDLQVTRGGPLLMVQVENEYGSYGEDHEYIAALRDILKENFEVPLYTNDGGVDWTLEGGSIPGALAEIDGDPSSGFNARRMYINDSSELGPLLDGEYYTYAPDQWGSYNTHNSTVRDPQAVSQFVKDLDYVLGNESASISLYMVHGGTNFGFGNGALWQNRTTAFTTSYDYSSPIDESGRLSEYYHTIRDTVQRYVSQGSIPNVPADVPRMEIPSFELSAGSSLFDTLHNATLASSPMTMEELGQAYGFVLYTHTATCAATGVIHPGDHPRDRVLVYVNGAKQGVIDSQYQHPLNISVSLKPSDKLQLLVENLGRVDYYSRGNYYDNHVLQPHKGIVGNVTVGDSLLTGWDMHSIPLTSLPSQPAPPSYSNPSHGPVFYHGTFNISSTAYCASTAPASLDTYLSVPSGVKGNVFVNGFNLGRYWRVGPQQSLYLPGTVMREGQNEVVVFELEPEEVIATMMAVGEAERRWGNAADVDCIGCV